jgi:hypothetical protein
MTPPAAAWSCASPEPVAKWASSGFSHRDGFSQGSPYSRPDVLLYAEGVKELSRPRRMEHSGTLAIKLHRHSALKERKKTRCPSQTIEYGHTRLLASRFGFKEPFL